MVKSPGDLHNQRIILFLQHIKLRYLKKIKQISDLIKILFICIGLHRNQ